MFETVINLKPESEWRPGMTVDKLIAEMDKALQFPGVSQRLDHADQGAHRHALDRHPHAGRRQGARHRSRRDGAARAPDRGRGPHRAGHHQRLSPSASSAATTSTSIPTAPQLARYGLMVGDVQDVIAMALGAEPVTTTVEGRERYTVSMRYPRDFRSDPQAIATRGADPDGRRRHRAARPGRQGRARAGPGHHPHRERPARRLHLRRYPRPRHRRLRRRRAEGGGERRCKFPPGYLRHLERPVRVSASAPRRGCKIVVPVTLLIIFLLLYLNFRRVTETLIVMLSVPFALVGGLWLMWWLGFNLWVAVAVGFIALAGVAAETGVVMLIYLDHALDRAAGAARGRRAAVHARRSLRRHHGRRGRARAAEDDDGRRHHGRPAADHVEPRHRLRGDAAHRRADDRRHGVVDPADADRDPGDLRAGERRCDPLAALGAIPAADIARGGHKQHCRSAPAGTARSRRNRTRSNRPGNGFSLASVAPACTLFDAGGTVAEGKCATQSAKIVAVPQMRRAVTSRKASPEKAHCFDYVELNAKAIAVLNDSIFWFGELGMQEFETAKLMTALLETAGLPSSAAFPAFRPGSARAFGSGHPVVAIHTEYDANPDNSQAPGVLEQAPLVEGAPGHCEGHNVNAAVLVASALAVRSAMAAFGLAGTLKVFGAPAEEQLVSRPYFVRDGWFDDVDVALCDHIGSTFAVGYGLMQSALGLRDLHLSRRDRPCRRRPLARAATRSMRSC